ncbi:MAG: hypothetical protein ACOH5I_07420 [Oligoflexus sp.]
MKSLILLSLIIASAFLSGCSHTNSSRLDAILASWQDKDPDLLVKTWGAPVSTYTLREGGLVLTYQHNRMSSRLSFYRYPENFADSYICKVSFYTDAKQQSITNGNYQGDASTCLEIATMPPAGEQSQPEAIPSQ